TDWPIADRNEASRRYQAQRDSNRELQARILQLTERQRSARRAAAAQVVLVGKLTRENAGLRAETAHLQKTRTGLDARIAKLRADNRRFVFAIDRFNRWNAALATKINGPDDAYDGLAGAVVDLPAPPAPLRRGSG